jgi:hypothetical protein
MDLRVLIKGMPVIINDMKLRTFGCVGVVEKTSINAKGNTLCHINLYKGAPPLKISPEKLKVETVENFWMVVGRTSKFTNYVGEAVNGDLKVESPKIKFYSKESAIKYGKDCLGDNFLLLEPTILIKSDIEVALK